MWQRFTERARRIILLAQEEAGKRNSPHVDLEHMLLGLVREREGVGGHILQRYGMNYSTISTGIAETVPTSSP